MNLSRHPPGLLAHTLCRAALALSLMLGVAAAHATSITDAVTGSGGSWGGAGNNTWTPTAAGSVVSAAEVNGKLVAASHVTVLTHTSDPTLAVKAALTLAATSHLELSSHGDIAIHAPVQAGGASVTMRYGQGSVAAGNTATIGAAAPVHLSTSSMYTTLLGSDGAGTSHTIITTLGAQGSTSGADLQGMQGNLAGHYVLGEGIDANAFDFAPIGSDVNPFQGSFDGLGHIISNLIVVSPSLSTDYLGLFGAMSDAVLTNVKLKNVSVNGRSELGALAGYASGGRVSNAMVEGGRVSGVFYVGGLVGRSNNLLIDRSYVNMEVFVASGGAFIGGLVGGGSALTLTNSYATGSLVSTGQYPGGLVGELQGASSISGCYSTMKLYSSNDFIDGLVSDLQSGTINDSFYATSGPSVSVQGTPKSLSELQTLATFTTAGWDIDDAGGTGKAWRIYEGQTTPLLRSLFTDSLTITANSGSKTVDGTTTALGVSFTPATPDARLLGTPVAAAASSAVGMHAVNVTGVHSTQRGYDITLVPGTLTINAVVVAPDAPTAAAATPGNALATVNWTTPASNGGSVITGYTVTGTPGGTCTAVAPATTCTVPGLTNGTPYTFTVVATNAVGDSLASIASAPITPVAPVVVVPPPPPPDPIPTELPIDRPGTTTITDPRLPVVIGAGAGGGTLVLPGTGNTPVTIQVTINGQPLQVQALPGTQLQIAQVDGQNVLVLVVLQGWAAMTSSAAGQPLVLAGPVLLRSGQAATRVEAIPLTVAVLTGSLVAPPGSLPTVGAMGLQAGERLQVDAQGAVVSTTLGSLYGNTEQTGDAMSFANLFPALTVDATQYARLDGAIARLAGINLAQGRETASSGVFLVRDGDQVLQLLPMQPITIDARLPDGVTFTPTGLLRWVTGGVVVHFAPAVADLAGLANAVTTALPNARLKLGAEGVLQLRTGGKTYVLRPDWTGGGISSTDQLQIGIDEQGRIYLQAGQGARQLLLPSLLNYTQASAILGAAMPGATLAVQPQANDGSMVVTLQGQQWRLIPQWELPEGEAVQAPAQGRTWWMGADGTLYLKLGTQVQGVLVAD